MVKQMRKLRNSIDTNTTSRRTKTEQEAFDHIAFVKLKFLDGTLVVLDWRHCKSKSYC